jgi:transcriptional regulator with XRE-family HTH domain
MKAAVSQIQPAGMTRRQVSAYTGFSIATLSRWASEDRGPPIAAKLNPHTRNGRLVYLREDVDAWLRSGAPTDRRGARPASWPAGGYGSNDRRRDPAGRFARVSPSP